MSDLLLELTYSVGQFVHTVAHPTVSFDSVVSSRTYAWDTTVKLKLKSPEFVDEMTPLQFTMEGSGGPQWTTSRYQRKSPTPRRRGRVGHAG